jgi:serine/threonine protein kinase
MQLLQILLQQKGVHIVVRRIGCRQYFAGIVERLCQNYPSFLLPLHLQIQFITMQSAPVPIELEDTGQFFLKPTLANRYQVLGTLGQGGMTTVYKGLDTFTSKLCIIKVIHPGMGRSEELKDSWQRESALLARLKHPNLPAFLGFFELLDGRICLVTELIEGETLQEKLNRGEAPFSEEQVVLWAYQLCDALNTLHNRPAPIIHENVKPENIMVDKYGQIKLIDFGIARIFKPGKQVIQMPLIPLGTPGYCAPEQFGTGQTDARSDIYSLGVTLFHLTYRTRSLS